MTGLDRFGRYLLIAAGVAAVTGGWGAHARERAAREPAPREALTMEAIPGESRHGAADTFVPHTRESLNLYVGEVRVLQVGELRRIAIGNGKVLQASALDGGQLLLIPEAAGQSVVYLWGKDGRERHLAISVVPGDTSLLLEEVRGMLGNTPGVQPRIVGDKVVIEGAGVSEEHATRIAEVAGRYPQIVNLVSRVGRERMIEMDVRMVEIRRDAMQSLGVQWNPSMRGPSFGVIGDLHRSSAFRAGGAAGEAGLDTRTRVAPFASALGIASSITSMINLMVQNGAAVVLAEPRLACRSGGSARFMAGGELPIPYTSG